MATFLILQPKMLRASAGQTTSKRSSYHSSCNHRCAAALLLSLRGKDDSSDADEWSVANVAS